MTLMRIHPQTPGSRRRRRDVGPTRSTIATIALGMLLGACATAATDFRPYSERSVRSPSLDRAVEVSEHDLPALAAAGAVIVGTVTARGNGFAGVDHVAGAAAEEAARHGGTHVVLGMSVEKSARGERLQSSGGAVQRSAIAAYYPGRTVALTALVLRLPEGASWGTLPPSLRPGGDARSTGAAGHERTGPPDTTAAPAPNAPAAATDASPAAAGAPAAASMAPTAVRAPLVIDGSHIAPLPASDD